MEWKTWSSRRGEKLEKWHPWFAWYPVEIIPNHSTWLVWVHRKGERTWSKMLTNWEWEYRDMPEAEQAFRTKEKGKKSSPRLFRRPLFLPFICLTALAVWNMGIEPVLFYAAMAWCGIIGMKTLYKKVEGKDEKS